MGTEHQNHEDVVKRLKRAGGHLAKVVRMIEEGQPCTAVAQQLQAVSKAVENAKKVFIQDHIEHCLDEEMVKGASAREILRDLKEISKYL